MYLRSLVSTKKSTLFNGLVGYWKMDDINGTTVYDNSGNGNNGSIVSEVTAGHRGAYGKSLYFVGADDYVSIPHSASLAITGDITLAFWVNVQATTGDRMIISKSTGFDANPYQLYMNTAVAGGWKMRYGRGNGTTTVRRNSSWHGGGYKWVFCVVTQSGTTVNFYMNGNFVNSDTISTTTTDGGGTLRLGVAHDGSRDFSGFLDEVRIWNRAITGAEVTQIYNDTKLMFRPVLRFEYDEASGTAYLDSSYRGNNGTQVGDGTPPNSGYAGIYQNGRSIWLDNTEDYVTVENNIGSLDLTGDFTIITWARKEVDGADAIISKCNGSVANPLFFAYDDDTGDGNYPLRLYLGNGTAQSSVVSTDKAPKLNEWNHLAVVRSGTSVTFYINGVVDSGGAKTLSTTVTNSSGQLWIGERNDSSLDFGGGFDHTLFYNWALPATSIAMDYKETDTIGFYSELEFWAKLDATSGTTITDYSKNKNHGTITGTYTLNQTGRINKAILFSTDAYSSHTVGTFPTIGTGNFAISFWYKSTYSTDRICAFSFNASNVAVYVDGSGATKGLQIDIGGSNYASTNFANTIDGNWHHGLVQRIGSTIYFYIDNTALGTATNSTSISAPSALYVGQDDSGDQEFFEGTLDDIRFYSRNIPELEAYELSQMVA